MEIKDVESFTAKQAAKINYPRLLVWKDVLFHPDETLANELKEPSLRRGATDVFVSSFFYMLTIVLFYVLIYGVMFGAAIAFGAVTEGRFDICVYPIAIFIAALLGAVVVAALIAVLWVMSWLIGAGFEFILAKLLGGKGTYTAQAHLTGVIMAAMYAASIPIFITSLIPCVGLVLGGLSLAFSAYIIYIKYKMIKLVHGLSRNRAIVVTLIPVGMVLLLIAALVAAYFLVVASFLAAGMRG